MKTQIIGKRFHHFPVLSSTNDKALALLAEGHPPEGTVVVADHQLAGRGQRGAVWEGAAGKNLFCSVILYPEFLGAEHSFVLSQAVAVAVALTIKQVASLPVRIKWPNDIMVHSQKVGGILIQNGFQGPVWKSCVVGIGLNVNQANIGRVVRNALSMFDLTGQEHDLKEILNDLVANLDKYYKQLKQGAFERIQSQYLKRLFLSAQSSRYQLSSGQVVIGEIIGVSPSGLLEMKIEGQLRRFDIKDIQWVGGQSLG